MTLRLVRWGLGLVALGILVACGGESQSAPSDLDAETLLAETGDAMAGLQSYHVDVRFGEEAEPVGIDFAWRDGHFFMDAHPEPEVDLLREDVAASISLAVLGPSPSHVPHWSIVALRTAKGAEVAEVGEMDGIPSVHLRARVNHLRAILESQREIVAGARIAAFARSCEEGQPDRCRDLSFEEVLALQEPELSLYDDNETVVDVWVGTDDRLARRIEFAIPSFEVPAGPTVVRFEFSRFDEVESPGTPVLPPVP